MNPDPHSHGAQGETRGCSVLQSRGGKPWRSRGTCSDGDTVTRMLMLAQLPLPGRKGSQQHEKSNSCRIQIPPRSQSLGEMLNKAGIEWELWETGRAPSWEGLGGGNVSLGWSREILGAQLGLWKEERMEERMDLPEGQQRGVGEIEAGSASALQVSMARGHLVIWSLLPPALPDEQHMES